MHSRRNSRRIDQRQQKRDKIKKHEEMRDYLLQNKKELASEENLAEQMLEA